MATDYKALLDMLNPKKEEEQLFSPINPTQEQLSALVQPESTPAVEEPVAIQAPARSIPTSKPVTQKEANPFMEGVPSIDSVMARLPKSDQAGISQLPEDGSLKPAPMSKSEALLAEYQKMLGRDQEELKAARDRDRMLKVGGALGDALATYLNAQSQMNVKAPGVQVQQGAGLGRVADMFATAPEIASDISERRKQLLDQYKQMAISESSTAKRELEKQRLAAMEEKNRLYGRQIEKMGSGKEEARQFREEKFEYDKVKNLQDSFNKDKQVVKAEERMASAKTMREFLMDNNPIGAEAAKRFAARASGEVGTLTDQDVSVFGGSRAVLDRLKQSTQQLATGTLTEDNRKFMMQLADTFEKAGQRDLQDRLNIYAKQGTKRTKMTEDEVKETIRPDLVLQQSQQPAVQKATLSTRDQQALDWASKNPNDPRAAQIRKRLGM